MKRFLLLSLSLALSCTALMAQDEAENTDHRKVVSVTLKASPEARRWAPVVYNSVVEMLVKSQRFRVIDAENKDQIQKELERQKGAEFMDVDPNTLTDLTKALAANKSLAVKVDKVPVYAFKTNGNVSGYKCAVAYQLILTDMSTQSSNESESFQGKTSKEMLSAQAAVVEATKDTEPMVEHWLTTNFPLECSIEKIMEMKGDQAKSVLLDMGSAQGLAVGDEFKVEYVEMLKGKPFPTEIGTVKIKELKGEDFAVAEVSGKDAAKQILSHFSASHTLKCVQIIKKK